jgi:hypothetical protein
MKYKPVGWRHESFRHSLAARRIRTKIAEPAYDKYRKLRDQGFSHDSLMNPNFGVVKDDSEKVAEELKSKYDSSKSAEKTRKKLVSKKFGVPVRYTKDYEPVGIGGTRTLRKREVKRVRNLPSPKVEPYESKLKPFMGPPRPTVMQAEFFDPPKVQPTQGPKWVNPLPMKEQMRLVKRRSENDRQN